MIPRIVNHRARLHSSFALFIRLNSNLPINRPEDENSLNQKFNPDKSNKVSKPSASIPSINPNLKKLLTPSKPYSPNLNKTEINYNFNNFKSPKTILKDNFIKKSKPKSKFRKMLPSLLICTTLCWAIFTYKYFNNNKDPNIDNNTSLLSTNEFLPYLISFKYKINDNLYLIELTRKNRSEKLINNEQLFDGSKIWSIEIMNPDINIVRNYTPLPLYVAGIDPNTKEPHLRLVENLEQEGKFILIVKYYNDGEFSKWLINKSILNEIKIRGPIIDYKFPFHPLDKYDKRPQMSNTLDKIKPDPIYPDNLPKPENYIFFGAGTGILPLFQLIYSPNPPKGFIDIWYSLNNENDLLPQLKTLNFFAENCGRVKFHYLINNKINLSNIPYPSLPNFTGGLDLRISEEVYKQKLLREKKQQIKQQLSNNSDTSTDSSSLTSKTDLNKPTILENNSNIIIPTSSKIKSENAYQQWKFFRSKNEKLSSPSFAFICGPESYISDLSGKPDLNNLERKDNGPIGGMLKEKGWNLKNIKRLQ